MKKIRIRDSRRAVKFLENIRLDLRRRILERIAGLSENPFPKGCVKLSGVKNVYRLRIEIIEYRISCSRRKT